jgi:hypothetical protein
MPAQYVKAMTSTAATDQIVAQSRWLPSRKREPNNQSIAVSSIKDRVAPEDPSRPSSSGCRG